MELLLSMETLVKEYHQIQSSEFLDYIFFLNIHNLFILWFWILGVSNHHVLEDFSLSTENFFWCLVYISPYYYWFNRCIIESHFGCLSPGWRLLIKIEFMDVMPCLLHLDHAYLNIYCSFSPQLFINNSVMDLTLIYFSISHWSNLTTSLHNLL